MEILGLQAVCPIFPSASGSPLAHSNCKSSEASFRCTARCTAESPTMGSPMISASTRLESTRHRPMSHRFQTLFLSKSRPKGLESAPKTSQTARFSLPEDQPKLLGPAQHLLSHIGAIARSFKQLGACISSPFSMLLSCSSIHLDGKHDGKTWGTIRKRPKIHGKRLKIINKSSKMPINPHKSQQKSRSHL